METCPVCSEKLIASMLLPGGLHEINCSRCGKFKAAEEIKFYIEDKKFSLKKLAAIVRYIVLNQGIEIKVSDLDFLFSIEPLSFHETADEIFTYLVGQTKYAGDIIDIQSILYKMKMFGCVNAEELYEVLSHLNSMGYIKGFIEPAPISSHLRIAPSGWAKYEELRKTQIESEQGFVAMWFADALNSVYIKAISPAILNAGYKPHRVDQREHNDKIDDEIIIQIRRSKFIIADFTGHRGGVYFEAGFAKGLGREVFWTCRKDEIEKLHFDIRQHNCIDWEPDKLDEFRQRLARRIEAVLGKGPYRPE